MSDLTIRRGADTPVSALSKLLTANQKQIEMVLPKHMRPERMIRLAVTALNVTPGLQDCSLLSICNSVMLASQLGLEYGNGLGHAYLIPYGKVCTLIPGYRGLMDLGYRAGAFKRCQPLIVYAGDDFDYREGQDLCLKHIPRAPSNRTRIEGPEEYEWLGAYNRAELPDSTLDFMWMWKEEILSIRDKCSRSRAQSPWVTWFKEMALKTVVKRHMKFMRLSAEAGLAVGIDDQVESYLSKPETLKDKGQPVQDLVLTDGIIDEARQADDTLAGSREAQQEVVAEKLAKRGRPKKEDRNEAEAIGIQILQKLLASGQDEPGMNALLRTASYTDGNLKWIEMENLKDIKDVAYLTSILKNLENEVF